MGGLSCLIIERLCRRSDIQAPSWSERPGQPQESPLSRSKDGVNHGRNKLFSGNVPLGKQLTDGPATLRVEASHHDRQTKKDELSDV